MRRYRYSNTSPKRDRWDGAHTWAKGHTCKEGIPYHLGLAVLIDSFPHGKPGCKGPKPHRFPRLPVVAHIAWERANGMRYRGDGLESGFPGQGHTSKGRRWWHENVELMKTHAKEDGYKIGRRVSTTKRDTRPTKAETHDAAQAPGAANKPYRPRSGRKHAKSGHTA